MKGTISDNVSAFDASPGSIRIGLLLPSSMTVAAWEFRALERIFALMDVSVEFAVLLSGADQDAPRPGAIAGWYLRMDSRNKAPKGNPLAQADPSPVLRNVPRISPDDLRRQHTGAPVVDVLVQFGPHPPERSLASAARFGLWYQPESSGGMTTGFFEKITGKEAALSAVEACDASGRIVTLARSYGSTSDSSPARIRHPLLWKSSAMMARQLRILLREGEGSSPFSDTTAETTETHPANGGSFRTLRHISSSVSEKILRKGLLDQWHLLYHFGPAESPSPPDPTLFTPIIPPKDRFWADPFIVFASGNFHIFIEESLMKPRKKGYISVLQMDQNGQWQPPVKVIDQPYHLSYPFLFEHQGEWYMIPESGQNKTIDLYRCVEFPFRWEHHRVIMEGVRAVDTTLVFHEDRWWMFSNMEDSEGSSLWDELYVFWSKDPVAGPWVPHPNNPVVSDARRARPAGNLYRAGNSLYRPSQDCGLRYGYALNINEVVRLNEREYKERVAHRVEPPRRGPLKAIHTLNSANGLTVMDGILRRRKFS